MTDPEKLSSPDSSTATLDIETSVDDIPTPGLTAWLQVAGAFGINFTTWGLSSSYGSFQTLYTSPSSTNPLFHTSSPNLPSASQIAWIGSLQSGLLFLTAFLAGDRKSVV